MSNIPDELLDFVKSGLLTGRSRVEIEKVLLEARWTKEQTRSALASFAESDFPIPVPRPRPYLDAREAFIYLVLFSTLYVSAYHLGSLLFDIINVAFPDAANPSSPQHVRTSIRWSIATLIVAFPVFLDTSWLVARDLAADPNKRHSRVRRGLTYLTLFVAASVLTGDVITLVYNLLGGEITRRFLMKVLVVACIGGTVFWYYLSDINRDEGLVK